MRVEENERKELLEIIYTIFRQLQVPPSHLPHPDSVALMLCINKTPMHSGVPQTLAQTRRRELAKSKFLDFWVPAKLFWSISSAIREQPSEWNFYFSFRNCCCSSWSCSWGRQLPNIQVSARAKRHQQRNCCNSFSFVLFTYRRPCRSRWRRRWQTTISGVLQVLPGI